MAQQQPHGRSAGRPSADVATGRVVLRHGRAARATMGRPANDNRASVGERLLGAGALLAILAAAAALVYGLRW